MAAMHDLAEPADTEWLQADDFVPRHGMGDNDVTQTMGGFDMQLSGNLVRAFGTNSTLGNKTNASMSRQASQDDYGIPQWGMLLSNGHPGFSNFENAHLQTLRQALAETFDELQSSESVTSAGIAQQPTAEKQASFSSGYEGTVDLHVHQHKVLPTHDQSNGIGTLPALLPASALPLGISRSKHTCDKCSETFTERKSLLRHLRAIHQGQRLACLTCGELCSRKDSLRRHIRDQHNGKVECADCGKKLHPQSLKGHACPEVRKQYVTSGPSPLLETLFDPAAGVDPLLAILDLCATLGLYHFELFQSLGSGHWPEVDQYAYRNKSLASTRALSLALGASISTDLKISLPILGLMTVCTLAQDFEAAHIHYRGFRTLYQSSEVVAEMDDSDLPSLFWPELYHLIYVLQHINDGTRNLVVLPSVMDLFLSAWSTATAKSAERGVSLADSMRDAVVARISWHWVRGLDQRVPYKDLLLTWSLVLWKAHRPAR